jgi:hypothetical protein
MNQLKAKNQTPPAPTSPTEAEGEAWCEHIARQLAAKKRPRPARITIAVSIHSGQGVRRGE